MGRIRHRSVAQPSCLAPPYWSTGAVLARRSNRVELDLSRSVFFDREDLVKDGPELRSDVIVEPIKANLSGSIPFGDVLSSAAGRYVGQCGRSCLRP